MAIANPEVEFHLQDFIGECVAMLNEHYESKFPRLNVPDVKVSEGGKFYKVYKDDGLIWKPASWKAPARNFPRGNILEDKARDVIGVYGI